MSPSIRGVALTLLGALIGAGVVAGIGFARPDNDPMPQPVAVLGALTSQGGNPSSSASLSQPTGMDFSALYETLRPSIVEITTGGQQTGRSRQAGGLGSGIVLDTSGNILTNNHVVSGFTTATVTFADGATGQAQVVGTDPSDDIAIINVQADASELHAAKLGDSSQVKVGNVVLAIGNPFGLEGTLTTGVISGVDRTLSPGSNQKPLSGLLQTDAAVNPGNSGGALFNVQGEVIGINAAIENPSGADTFAGVAYAVPINTAQRELAQLLKGTTINHARLGIAGHLLSPSEAQQLGVPYGLAVDTVASGSGAAQAGLRDSTAGPADVIVAVDGRATKVFSDLLNYIDSKNVGDQVTLTVHRDGKDIQLTVTLQVWGSAG
jgi:S1-C subfamily serine protease